VSVAGGYNVSNAENYNPKGPVVTNSVLSSSVTGSKNSNNPENMQ